MGSVRNLRELRIGDGTLNTLLLGKRVIFEPAAISYTTSPGWLPQLLNQRYRWTRGNIQAVHKSWRRWHEVPNPPRALPFWLGIFMVESFLWPIVLGRIVSNESECAGAEGR